MNELRVFSPSSTVTFGRYGAISLQMEKPAFDKPIQLGEWTLPSGRLACAWLEPDGGVSLGWDVSGPVEEDLSKEDSDHLLTIIYSEAQSRARTYQRGAC